MLNNIDLTNTNWVEIQKGYCKYSWIMNNLNNLNEDFITKFTHFYRINQGLKHTEYRNSFFNLLSICLKNNNDDYSEILNDLSAETGRNEMSFASKIVASINPEKPIIDKFVLKHFKLNRPCFGELSYRISKSVLIYKEIENYYNDFLIKPNGKKLIKEFDLKIKQEPTFKITRVKKLDFILWQTRN